MLFNILCFDQWELTVNPRALFHLSHGCNLLYLWLLVFLIAILFDCNSPELSFCCRFRLLLTCFTWCGGARLLLVICSSFFLSLLQRLPGCLEVFVDILVLWFIFQYVLEVFDCFLELVERKVCLATSVMSFEIAWFQFNCFCCIFSSLAVTFLFQVSHCSVRICVWLILIELDTPGVCSYCFSIFLWFDELISLQSFIFSYFLIFQLCRQRWFKCFWIILILRRCGVSICPNWFIFLVLFDIIFWRPQSWILWIHIAQETEHILVYGSLLLRRQLLLSIYLPRTSWIQLNHLLTHCSPEIWKTAIKLQFIISKFQLLDRCLFCHPLIVHLIQINEWLSLGISVFNRILVHVTSVLICVGAAHMQKLFKFVL